MKHSWLKKVLSAEDLREIEKAVAAVEKKTSGEVVPMIVRRSSTVGHLPLVFFFFGLLLYFVLGIPEWLHENFESYWWVIFLWSALLWPVVFLLSRVPLFQRLLVSRKDRVSQSQQRAMNEFYHHKLNNTRDATGILLFVSLVDHQAVVLADKAIAEKLTPEVWQQVVELLLSGIRLGDMAQGFCGAIEKCGEILEPHFPIQPGDINELPNHLIIKE